MFKSLKIMKKNYLIKALVLVVLMGASNSLWAKYEKWVYTVDSVKNLGPDSTSATSTTKTEYNHDIFGNELGTISYKLNTTTSVFDPYIKTVKKYDQRYFPKFQLLENVQYQWKDAKWVGQAKHNFKYDDAQNIVEDWQYSWNTTDSAWVNYSKTEYTYDASTLQEEVKSNWNMKDAVWKLSEKTIYIYDEQGHKTKSEVYVPNGTEGDWKFQKYHTYVCDKAGNVLIDTLFNPSGTEGQYKPYSVYDCKYDERNNMIERILSYNQSGWFYSDKWQFGYDQYNNQTDQVKFRWNSKDSKWEHRSTQTTYYKDRLFVAYEIKVTINDTTMGHVDGAGWYGKDSTVVLTAYPNEGYNFVEWNTGKTTSPINPYHWFNLSEDKDMTATFEKNPETAVENVNDNVNDNHNCKFLRNGQLYIRRGDAIYDAKGQVVK